MREMHLVVRNVVIYFVKVVLILTQLIIQAIVTKAMGIVRNEKSSLSM